MSDKQKMVLMGFFTFTFLIGVGAFAVLYGEFDLKILILLVLSLMLVILIIRKFKAIKNGEVLEDEMTHRLREKAGFRTFVMSLYLWIVLNYIYDFDSDAFTFGMIGMALLFAGNYLFLASKES